MLTRRHSSWLRGALALALASSVACSNTRNSAVTPATPPPSTGGAQSQPGERVCTMIGCAASVVVEASLSAQDAAVGEHRIALEVDGVAQTCTLRHTDATQTSNGSCTGGFSVSIGPVFETRTVESSVPGTVAAEIAPVAGRFVLRLEASETPASVHFVHTFSGRTVLDRTVRPTYETVYPNGAGCEPGCRQSRTTVQ